MNLFDKHISEIRNYMTRHQDVTMTADSSSVQKSWPEGGKRNIILASETAVELGHPDTASTSLLVWTGSGTRVNSGMISIAGPDLPESRGKSLPFGRILLVSGEGFTEDNCYDRYREMERLRFNLDLKGYMLRAASQYRREWSRVSRDALDRGLSLQIIGAELLKKVQEFPWVTGAEILYVTSSREAVEDLESITTPASRIIETMNRLVEDLSHNCGECDLEDVCTDIEDLKNLRRAATNKKEKSNGGK